MGSIRKAIQSRTIQRGLTYRTLAKSTGIEYETLRAFVKDNAFLPLPQVLAVMVFLDLSFGYTDVGVALYPADTIKQRVISSLSNRGISQKDFAVYCGINICTFNNWIKDKRQLPLDSLEKVVTALGMDVFPMA